MTGTTELVKGYVKPGSGPAVDARIGEQLSRMGFASRDDDLYGDRGMFQNGIALLKRLCPLGLLAMPFGTVYCLLLYLFPDSIEAYVRMRTYTAISRWGGVERLFVLNSLVLGWVGAVVSERRAGAVGPVVLLFALPCCFAAIGGGFAISPLFLGGLSGAMKEMLAYSLVASVGASILRAYWGSIH